MRRCPSMRVTGSTVILVATICLPYSNRSV
jgi:hypothetical protein